MTGFRIGEARLHAGKVMAIAFFVAIVFNGHRPPRAVLYEVGELFGLAMLIVCTLGRIWCATYIAGRKNELVCDTGPYSLCRNPLYVFSLLGAVGMGLAAQSVVLTVAAAVGFICMYHFVIRSEERFLRTRFGDDFQSYVDRVPRWWPRWSGYDPGGPVTISPKALTRNIRDASAFLWLFMALEVLEDVKNTDVLPILWWLN